MDLNLLIASDANYLPHAVVALTSACESNRLHRLRIFYLHAGLGEEEMDRVHAHFSRYAAVVNFIRVDDERLRQLHTHAHLTAPAYYRLLCADALPPSVDRVIYLDCDVIVRAALDEIYTADLELCTIAAVRDAYLNDAPWPTWRAQINALVGAQVREYFNSGVMLIDVARYRSTGVGSAVIELLNRFHRNFNYADQDALNVVLAQRWKALPSRWNVQSHWYTLDYCIESTGFSPEQRNRVFAAIRDPAIIHYTATSKPWHFINTHPLKPEYWKYRQLTPYAAR